MSASRGAPASQITVVGAGLAGCLISILLVARGHRVRIHERFADMRRVQIPTGRSINLALAARGIRALEAAGVMQAVLPLLIPMRGRMVHALDGALTFVPYGQREHEVIYSVSRPGLNRLLLDAAEGAGVEISFGQTLVDADMNSRRLIFSDAASGTQRLVDLGRTIGADGAGSVLRRAAIERAGFSCSEVLLEHRYKELSLPPGPGSRHCLEKNALHIWPRGGFMLIALPNLDGSFTLTLFLPEQGESSFESLVDPAVAESFFAANFADVREQMPDLTRQLAENATGIMGTVCCERWALGDELLLIGDAAHAITPFHGQGMNCALEDCRELAEALDRNSSWQDAFADFETARRPNTNAIAEMALENYVEMRDTVREPKFLLQKALSLELEKRYPQRFVPRYSMVMFHDEIPYRVAYERGQVQSEILARLTQFADNLAEVDYALAERLVEERLPAAHDD